MSVVHSCSVETNGQVVFNLKVQAECFYYHHINELEFTLGLSEYPLEQYPEQIK